MSNNSNLYRFLKLTRGTWRNAFYIECPVCSYKKSDCYGYLLTTNAEGTPIILSVSYFEKITGDKVDKSECAAIITKEAFAKMFGVKPNLVGAWISKAVKKLEKNEIFIMWRDNLTYEKLSS